MGPWENSASVCLLFLPEKLAWQSWSKHSHSAQQFLSSHISFFSYWFVLIVWLHPIITWAPREWSSFLVCSLWHPQMPATRLAHGWCSINVTKWIKEEEPIFSGKCIESQVVAPHWPLQWSRSTSFTACPCSSYPPGHQAPGMQPSHHV